MAAHRSGLCMEHLRCRLRQTGDSGGGGGGRRSAPDLIEMTSYLLDSSPLIGSCALTLRRLRRPLVADCSRGIDPASLAIHFIRILPQNQNATISNKPSGFPVSVLWQQGRCQDTFRALPLSKAANPQMIKWGPAMSWQLIQGGSRLCPYEAGMSTEVCSKETKTVTLICNQITLMALPVCWWERPSISRNAVSHTHTHTL